MATSTGTERPTIVMIHGSWHNPSHYEGAMNLLKSHGYPYISPHLPTDGGGSTLTMLDDANLVRSEIVKLVEDEGKEVVVVMHSYGGVVGSQACEGLGRVQRQQKGLAGGVIRLYYMCAFVLPAGQSLDGMLGGPPPFIVTTPDGYRRVEGPANIFYHDLPPDMQAQWVAQLKRIPMLTQTTPTTFAAYKEIPSTYLYCEDDRAIPFEVQKMMVGGSGVDMHTESIFCSHSPFLSQPEKLVASIRRAAGEANVTG